jgi:predicted phosphodiesterase
MTHIGGYPDHYDRRALAHIHQTRPTIFVAGHSHFLKVIYDKRFSMLHLNPGAAGRYGFHKVRTALRFTLDGGEIRDMEIGEWPR